MDGKPIKPTQLGASSVRVLDGDPHSDLIEAAKLIERAANSLAKTHKSRRVTLNLLLLAKEVSEATEAVTAPQEAPPDTSGD